MTTPIKGTISANLKTVINTVTTGNGYNQTITCYRSKHVDFGDIVPENNTALLTWLGEKTLTGTSGKTHKTGEYSIFVYIIPASNTVEIDVLHEQVSADIEKALMADQRLSSTALTLRVTDVTAYGEGVEILVEVDYRTTDTNPYA